MESFPKTIGKMHILDPCRARGHATPTHCSKHSLQAPIINEPDDNHNAQSHMNAIETVLASFGKSLTRVFFLIGDNCSVNKKLARLMDVPLVGCVSHRLNLAVKLLTATHEAELGKIQSFMIKLRTLNQAAALRYGLIHALFLGFLNSHLSDFDFD